MAKEAKAMKWTEPVIMSRKGEKTEKWCILLHFDACLVEELGDPQHVVSGSQFFVALQ